MTLLLTEDLQSDNLMLQSQFSDDLTDKNKKKYNLINDETRRKVVEMVEVNNASLKEASKTFGIKLSTCKAILQVFQKEGRFEKKKKRIRKNSNLLGKILCKEGSEEKRETKNFSSSQPQPFKQLFSFSLSKTCPFKLIPVSRLKKSFLSPKPKAKLFPRLSMDETSDSRSDIQTNCSSRSSFFKYPHVWRPRAKQSFNSTGSSPRQGISEDVSVMEEEENYGGVLKGMWKEVFEFFGRKNSV